MPKVAPCCFLRDLLDGVFARSSPDQCPLNKTVEDMYHVCKGIFHLMKPAKLAALPKKKCGPNIKRKPPLGSHALTSNGIARALPSKAAFLIFLDTYSRVVFSAQPPRSEAAEFEPAERVLGACSYIDTTLYKLVADKGFMANRYSVECEQKKTGKTQETYLLFHNRTLFGFTLILASLLDPQTFLFEHLDR